MNTNASDITEALFGIPSGLVVQPEITEGFIESEYGMGVDSFRDYMRNIGYSDAKVEEILLELYTEIKKRAANPEYEELLAAACSEIGSFYLDLKHDRAEDFLLEAFSIRSRLYGSDKDLHLASTMTRLGVFYMHKEKYEKAELMFFDAYTILKELYEMDGKLEEGYALAANNLGTFYYEVGRAEEGLKYFFEALNHKEALLCGGAIPLYNIALCYEDLGEYRRAADYFIKAASIKSGILDARDVLEGAVEVTNFDYVRERLEGMFNQGKIDQEVFEALVLYLEAP